MAGRERRYELPGIEDLTKEQERVLALPREGRHLIVGGPGTGKTTVCLLRARRHARNRNDYVFLVWNHLLHRASRALFDGDLTAVTWKSWFWREFRRLVGKGVPTLGTDSGGWQPEDWSAVARLLDDLPRSGNGTPGLPSLVIDEGQDMPPGFYDSLNSLGFENIFVAADQNQQIKDENSSRRDLEELLVGQVVELTYNHRNSYPIARLARAFYTGDPASPPPDLPPAAGTVYVPWLYRVDEAAMPRIARSILRHWDQDPRRLIGVIAPKNTVREKYLRELQHACGVVPLDNGRPVVETFYGRHRPDVRFDEGGVLVINAQACKGLEFDTVVLADIDQHFVDAADLDRKRKLFYVMVSRARQRVVMFMKKGGRQEIDEFLPADENVLCRKDLTREEPIREEHA
ncbi:MAG: ATP-binding domain-containing protein [Acidobacteriota bacterium]|nr:ATP-binding domain-containing protein [Acidobacteriota bacterium]